MKKLALMLALLLVSFPALAAEDFSGSWSGSFTGVMPDGQEHTEQIFMTLVHKGADLTGTAGPTAEQQWKVDKGKVDGNNVAFEVQAGGDTASGPLLKFTLAFADGHLKGTLNAEQGGMKLSAKVDTTRAKGQTGVRPGSDGGQTTRHFLQCGLTPVHLVAGAFGSASRFAINR
jgi:hypothetical protein